MDARVPATPRLRCGFPLLARRSFSGGGKPGYDEFTCVSARKHDVTFSRHNAPEVLLEPCPSKNRGSREDRVRAAPAVSCAMYTRKCAHEHTGPAGASRPSLRSGFTVYFELSPVNGSFATVAGGTPRSIRLDRCATADLTPAPRRQDHTTSPYASGAFVARLSRPPHLTARS